MKLFEDIIEYVPEDNRTEILGDYEGRNCWIRIEDLLIIQNDDKITALSSTGQESIIKSHRVMKRAKDIVLKTETTLAHSLTSQSQDIGILLRSLTDKAINQRFYGDNRNNQEDLGFLITAYMRKFILDGTFKINTVKNIRSKPNVVEFVKRQLTGLNPRETEIVVKSLGRYDSTAIPDYTESTARPFDVLNSVSLEFNREKFKNDEYSPLERDYSWLAKAEAILKEGRRIEEYSQIGALEPIELYKLAQTQDKLKDALKTTDDPEIALLHIFGLEEKEK